MSSEFMRRLEAKAIEAGIPEHVISRLTKNGRFAESRMRVVVTALFAGVAVCRAHCPCGARRESDSVVALAE